MREDYQFDRSKGAWAKDAAELDEIWRKRVKNDFLSLRLADKDDAKIREQLRKRYEGLARRMHQFSSDDVFQTFANAYTEALEPHTSYMSPSTSENFDISMRLSLEGIGAVLRGDNEYTTVQRTIPGGPARESGQVHADDRIVGVAQGLDGPMEDVVGWRLQDVVDKIRGPKGSVVRLQLLKTSSRLRRPARGRSPWCATRSSWRIRRPSPMWSSRPRPAGPASASSRSRPSTATSAPSPTATRISAAPPGTCACCSTSSRASMWTASSSTCAAMAAAPWRRRPR